MVVQGDSIASLAEAYGHFCNTIWEHADNAELRATREHMNVLLPGDVVVIPDRTVKEVAVMTGRRHQFRRRGVPALLRLQLYWNDKPCAGESFELTIGDDVRRGTTSDDGTLEVYVSPSAKNGTLIIGPSARRLELRFGHLDPAAAGSGVQQRLANLGFDDAVLSDALLRFQKKFGLPLTGDADEATLEALRDAHDTFNANVGAARAS